MNRWEACGWFGIVVGICIWVIVICLLLADMKGCGV